MAEGMETDLAVPASALSSSRRIGAIVTVRGPQGVEYRGRVTSMDGEIAVVRAFEELPHPVESPLNITLVQAIPPRKRRWVSSSRRQRSSAYTGPFLAFHGERARDGGGQDKSHRWPDIARRAHEMMQKAPRSHRFAPIRLQAGGRVVLWSRCPEARPSYEKERVGRLKDIVAAAKPPDSVIVVCGPEGGFTDDEAAFAALTGFHSGKPRREGPAMRNSGSGSSLNCPIRVGGSLS